MKFPSRLALAAAIALLSAPLHAQEEDSGGADVTTLYGRVYLMVDAVEAKGGSAPDVARRTRITDQSSLLGVRGTERLGSDLTAFFQLETGFPPDSNNGTFGNRNSGVGLRSARFGSIMMGRWDMPMKTAQVSPLDPFTDLALADITGAEFNQGNFSNREQNVIQYWSPKIGGFDFRAAYVPNEARTATANPSKYGASLVWSNRNVYLTYAYEKHRDIEDGAVRAGIEEEAHGLGGYVRVAGAKLMAHVGQYTRTGTRKQKAYALGVDWGFAGPNHLLAIYQNSRDGGDLTDAEQPRCDVIGVGYRYDFSRRTMFTAYYTKVNNKVGNLCNFGAATLRISDGQDPQGFSAGVRHVF
jgi:predicted porin